MNLHPPALKDRGLILALLLSGITLTTLHQWTGRTPAYNGRGHDGRYYAAMAGDPQFPTATPAPFCYRILTPALVKHLPGTLIGRFEIVNFLAWWAALIGWYCLARESRLSQQMALFGMLVLSLCAWGPMNSFFNPCYLDPMMFAFIIWGLFLMLRDSRWLWLLLPVAMLQREHAVIVWIAAFVRAIQQSGWSARVLTRYVALLLLTLGVLVAIRITIKAPPGTDFAPWEVTSQVARWLLHDPTYAIKSALAIAYALSIALIGTVLLPASRRLLHEQRWMLYFLFVCFLSLFGGSDKARLVFLAQPVLLLVFLHGLTAAQGTSPPRWVLATLLLLHVFVQFPPSLVLTENGLIAPLVDEPDRGTHAASGIIASAWPIELGRVAAHLAISLGLATAFLIRLTRGNKSASPALGVPSASGC